MSFPTKWIILGLDGAPAILTVIGNAIFFVTLLRSPSLHTPSNFLLGALCITDLIVGFICQPLFIVVLVGPKGRCCSTVIKAYNLIFGLSSLNSFLCGLLITFDRYAAVFHPYTYRTFASCRRYAFVTTIVFIVFAGYSALKIPYFEQSRMSFLIVDICIEFSVIVSVLAIYALLYRVVFAKTQADLSARHAVGTRQSDINKSKARDRRKTKTVAIIIAAFLACYTPLMVYYVMGLFFYENINPSYPYQLGLWSNFLALFNSCVNPMIYCARSSDIRRAALRMFRRNAVLPHQHGFGLKNTASSIS